MLKFNYHLILIGKGILFLLFPNLNISNFDKLNSGFIYRVLTSILYKIHEELKKIIEKDKNHILSSTHFNFYSS